MARYKYSNPPPEPQTALDMNALCGWAGADVADAAMQDAVFAAQWEPFALTDIPKGFDSAGKTVRGWEYFTKATGDDPDLTPQPTGNCIAAAYDDVCELTQCVQICAGEAATFKQIYSPYHYATGRVIIGKNQLRGGAGSIGTWQAKAGELYGILELTDDLPKYNKANVDAWGDDRIAEGKSFRDYIEKGKLHPVRDSRLVYEWEALRDSLYALKFGTIASSRGYTTSPNRDGFHVPSGTWQHQMGIWGYSENPKYPKWVAIKNQWGDVMGEIIDFETGKPWPRGFLRVPLEDFIRSHLKLGGAECIVYSGVKGFPVTTINPKIWTRRRPLASKA